MSVPGTLQSVQRAEFWGAILALQAYYPCHLGIDNLNVARIIGRLLDRGSLATPLPLIPEGDLVAIVQHMLIDKEPSTVRVTKVIGHAAAFDVERERVRAEDSFGNHEADAAADLGRRSQSQQLIGARRDLFTTRDLWYPIIGQLHRFMVAISRVSVNHDVRGGTAPDSLVWDRGGVVKRRKIEVRVNVDIAALPGPPGFLHGPWMTVPSGCVSGVGLFFHFTSFLSTLHWPVETGDMGHFGVSYLEMLILFEHWLCHRLLSENVTRMHLRANRPICFPPAPVSEGIQIRQGCQFISSLFRALGKISGGVGRFIPCAAGGHMSRLRHLGWLQCSHGLTSGLWNPSLCELFGYPRGAAAELLDGSRKLRHCTSTFSTELPPWSVSGVYGRGGVVGSSTTTHGDSSEVRGVRVWLTRKSRPGVGVQVTGHGGPDPGHPTPRRWKRLRSPSSEGVGCEVGEPRKLFPRLGVG